MRTTLIKFPLAATDGRPGVQRSLGTDRSGRVEYRLNSQGYRGPEFGDFTGSLVTIGCSYTLGIGLAQEHTWPELLAQSLGWPLINLAQGGVGVAWCSLQFLAMIQQGHRPRAVAVVWPTEVRSLWQGRQGPEHDQQQQLYHRAWCQDDQHMLAQATMLRLSVTELAQSLGMPLLELTWSEKLHGLWQIPEFPRCDLAHDQQHPGRTSHRLARDLLLAQAQKLNM